ncbi:male-enhanced antigen 1-like [Argiope bruennichi]|uniref:Male-enhanced antigen 1 n=1 Tax=Argiope bruennichi TaxID=94029 RepID=A0A8T0EWD1_ARGBR|nr:male-enhanced antigen 1-like [Argiope bruennichi]KAF8778595.1 hypothetical protein HNY73_015299 [Argiope bruennichi]
MAPIIPFPNEIPTDSAENNSNESPANFVSDSDSYSEDEDHDGYQPLSQDPENCFDNHSDDMDEDSNFLPDEEMMACGVSLPSSSLLLPAPSDEVMVSDSKGDLKKDLKMDEDHIETIKSVMKSITLPKSNLPQWATSVPEEEWKSALFSSMLNKIKNDNTNSCFGEGSKKKDSDFYNDVAR